MRKLFLASSAVGALMCGSVSAADGAWLTDPVTDCEIWSSGEPSSHERISWSGACIDGKAAGRGTAVFWDDDGLEARYDGDMINGKADGYGIVWMRNAEMTGYDLYEGSFVAGDFDGEVTISTHDGYEFTGEILDGKESAVGELISPDGWMMRGEILDGKMVGSAFVYFETEEGEQYAGAAENNQKHGIGSMVSPDETSYVGEFENGSPSGLGFLEDPTKGSRFVGQFASGSPNGVGTALDAEGVAYQGRFVDGVPDGTILVTMADGTQSTEQWQNGSKVE
ncbi:MORN repeat-containing protein [Tateyamaria pelophila]|uniref:hypothetical protein n=1 Tax=Tateyamaria pelophila TaxID=328415 RepID=UPI001CC0FFF7|nr:hypothetical protein [Tateyamaria pelophila]